MNLIEQLGGYDNAKKFINGECSDGFDVQSLRDALLEYRRQHNIFEVGDGVLRADMEQNAIFIIVEKSILNDSEVIFCSVNDLIYCFYSNILRHATPEEIAAGRRL